MSAYCLRLRGALFIINLLRRVVLYIFVIHRVPFPHDNMASLQRSALFEALQQHDRDSTAVVHSLSGRSFTYGSLLNDVAEAKEGLLSTTGRDDASIVGERIAFLVENSYDYVGAQLSSESNAILEHPLKLTCISSYPPLHPRLQCYSRSARSFLPSFRITIHHQPQRSTGSAFIRKIYITSDRRAQRGH